METSQKETRLWAECATSKQGKSKETGASALVSRALTRRGSSHTTRFAPCSLYSHPWDTSEAIKEQQIRGHV